MAATAMAAYYVQKSEFVPAEALKLAEYYSAGTGAEAAIAAGMGCVPQVRPDMDPALADALGVKPGAVISEAAIANLLAGKRADGADLPVAHAGRKTFEGEGGTRHRIAYVDLCLSMPKGASIAWAFAENPAEKHSILQAHHDAVAETLRYAEQQIGRASMGKARKGGIEAARWGWIGFTHFSSRPTLEHRNAAGDTELHSLPVAGDPNIHTHNIIPNVVVTESGRIVAMQRDLLKHRVKEFGAVYQAAVARNLRNLGIDVGLDAKKGLAFLPAIPEHIVKMFSRRTNEGIEGARAYAKTQGMDWDAMDEKARTRFLHVATQSVRQTKSIVSDADGGVGNWRARAAAVGWKFTSAIIPVKDRLPEPSRNARMDASFRISQDVLGDAFEKRAVLTGGDARWAAAVGLIAGGMQDTGDVDKLTLRMREEGVHHNGQRTWLQWRQVAPGLSKITTVLHEDQERELIVLAQDAAADHSADIAGGLKHAPVALGQDKEHAAKLHNAADRMVLSGRLAVMLGSAGVGKSTAMRPIIAARHEQGWEVYGTALSWRQARDMKGMGLAHNRVKAMSPLLLGILKGRIKVGPKTEIVVDELSQIGTSQLLTLLRLQKSYGFSLKMLGDARQAQAIEAGPVIELLRRALGEGAIPEIHTTIRQRTEREKLITGLFREGKVAEALKLKREDVTAHMAPGGYAEAVQAVADRWAERTLAMRDQEGWTVTISAPTNAAAHDISCAIRAVRVARGEVKTWGERQVEVEDREGERRVLRVSAGDRVRLFQQVRGLYEGKNGRKHSAVVGDNGSVLQVLSASAEGLRVRTDAGKEAFVSWQALRDKKSGAIKLAYGQALTIDSAQGITSDEHIMALINGSASVSGGKAYVAASRHRVTSWLITSEGAELKGVLERLPAGVEQQPSKEDLWANVARNLSKTDLKESALAFLESATVQARASVRTFQAAARMREAGQKVSQATKRKVAAHVVARQITKAVATMGQNMEVAARAPLPTRRYEISEADAADQFMDAARAFGLRPTTIIMDGAYHGVPREGQKAKEKGGGYRAHYSGIRPTIVLLNHKTGEKQTFSANGELKSMSPEQAQAARQKALEAERAAAATRVANEEAGASKARRMWAAGKPADPSHPYLVTKGVEPHGLRQDDQGRLLVPLRDVEGRIRNVQTISADGTKLYQGGAQKSAVFAVLGPENRRPGDAYGIAEGFATAATIREATGMTVIVALDASNIPKVARVLREREPTRQFVFYSDNDGGLAMRTPPLPNVGIERAKDAAAEVGGRVITPPYDPALSDTDFNDYAKRFGMAELRIMLRAAWREAPVVEASILAKSSTGQVVRVGAKVRA